jgi:predicted secreted hydrolase
VKLVLICAMGLVLAACAAPVEVSWQTETELNTAGFNLYRGEAAEGPYELKVNARLIPASPDPLTGGRYRFVDSSASPGIVYYYQLQEVETTGKVNVAGVIAVATSWLAVPAVIWSTAAVLAAIIAVLVTLSYGNRCRAKREASGEGFEA